MAVTCLTAITADKDELKDFHIRDGITSFHAFIDREKESGLWHVHRIPKLGNPRLNAMLPLICPHLVIDGDILITIGGQMRITGSLQPYIDKVSNGKYDIAIFKHPDRDCVYE